MRSLIPVTATTLLVVFMAGVLPSSTSSLGVDATCNLPDVSDQLIEPSGWTNYFSGLLQPSQSGCDQSLLDAQFEKKYQVNPCWNLSPSVGIDDPLAPREDFYNRDSLSGTLAIDGTMCGAALATPTPPPTPEPSIPSFPAFVFLELCETDVRGDTAITGRLLGARNAPPGTPLFTKDDIPRFFDFALRFESGLKVAKYFVSTNPTQPFAEEWYNEFGQSVPGMGQALNNMNAAASGANYRFLNQFLFSALPASTTTLPLPGCGSSARRHQSIQSSGETTSYVYPQGTESISSGFPNLVGLKVPSGFRQSSGAQPGEGVPMAGNGARRDANLACTLAIDGIDYTAQGFGLSLVRGLSETSSYVLVGECSDAMADKIRTAVAAAEFNANAERRRPDACAQLSATIPGAVGFAVAQNSMYQYFSTRHTTENEWSAGAAAVLQPNYVIPTDAGVDGGLCRVVFSFPVALDSISTPTLNFEQPLIDTAQGQEGNLEFYFHVGGLPVTAPTLPPPPTPPPCDLNCNNGDRTADCTCDCGQTGFTTVSNCKDCETGKEEFNGQCKTACSSVTQNCNNNGQSTRNQQSGQCECTCSNGFDPASFCKNCPVGQEVVNGACVPACQSDEERVNGVCRLTCDRKTNNCNGRGSFSRDANGECQCACDAGFNPAAYCETCTDTTKDPVTVDNKDVCLERCSSAAHCNDRATATGVSRDASGNCICTACTGDYTTATNCKCTSAQDHLPNGVCAAKCSVDATCNGNAAASQVTRNSDFECVCTGCSGGFTPESFCKSCPANQEVFSGACVAVCNSATQCNGNGQSTRNQQSGQCECTCSNGYAGAACDTCATGYHQYPNCVLALAQVPANVVLDCATAPTADQVASLRQSVATATDIAVENVVLQAVQQGASQVTVELVLRSNTAAATLRTAVATMLVSPDFATSCSVDICASSVAGSDLCSTCALEWGRCCVTSGVCSYSSCYFNQLGSSGAACSVKVSGSASKSSSSKSKSSSSKSKSSSSKSNSKSGSTTLTRKPLSIFVHSIQAAASGASNRYDVCFGYTNPGSEVTIQQVVVQHRPNGLNYLEPKNTYADTQTVTTFEHGTTLCAFKLTDVHQWVRWHLIDGDFGEKQAHADVFRAPYSYTPNKHDMDTQWWNPSDSASKSSKSKSDSESKSSKSKSESESKSSKSKSDSESKSSKSKSSSSSSKSASKDKCQHASCVKTNSKCEAKTCVGRITCDPDTGCNGYEQGDYCLVSEYEWSHSKSNSNKATKTYEEYAVCSNQPSNE